jgi:serine/threonine protein phosphatase PrpC
LFVVADGVGGGAMASRASRELVHSLHDSLGERRIDAAGIRDAVLRADREVGTASRATPDGRGSGDRRLVRGNRDAVCRGG